MTDGSADVIQLKRKARSEMARVAEKFTNGEIDESSRVLLFYTHAGDEGEVRWVTINMNAIEAVGIIEALKLMIYQEDGLLK